jgi:hypothetical protein
MRRRQLLEAEALVLKLCVEWANTRSATPKDAASLALLAATTRYQWILTKIDTDPPPTFEAESITQRRKKKL